MSHRPRRVGPLSVAPIIPFHEPDLVPEHKAAIIAALRWAWSEMEHRHLMLLRTGDEEQITAKLQDLLNERCNGERRASWLKDFETVTRGESQRTSDGRLGKKPDLTFRPPAYASVSNMTRWGWFVECKIIDGAASVTVYRNTGVLRYSSGEYAAWMLSAELIAFVRDGSEPATALHQTLLEHVGTKWHRPGLTRDQSESEHDRSRLVNPCVDQRLSHIWLQVPSTTASGRADGSLVVFFGRFVAVLRAWAAILAGTNRMPWPRFLAANAAGAVVWATAVGLGVVVHLVLYDGVLPEARARLQDLLVGEPGARAALERSHLVDILVVVAEPVIEDPDDLVVQAAGRTERSHAATIMQRRRPATLEAAALPALSSLSAVF